ncbi:hypothetical protein ACWT_5693 [Actinoplanes sp. SE50]|uniref:hypothetical protein n=1 Tax=unclassified Actinoplanes TaxID=2626549 RepID=UPI00023ED2DC|nr:MULTISPECIES: hypothetical protein [unclassified Actinoplanes]AEV86710.1 hypothetical protein ACPL_5823 [Actinoplanes sp. SE50/110]ATO85108.1 hypothetical protein ACWT_5693 [Actinoplanes sp. SE50]SLM02519.1 hypothetical protein ACSP50_5769 [Actinoplanes sp. SE50/110]
MTIPGYLDKHEGRWRLIWRDDDGTLRQFTAHNIDVVTAYATKHGIRVTTPRPILTLQPHADEPDRIMPDGPLNMRFSG